MSPESGLPGTVVARAPVSCRYQPACPGCPHFGVQSIAPEAQRQLSELATRLGAEPPEFFESPGFGRRSRVRLSVRAVRGKLGMGLFEAGSHRLVAIHECPLHHPAIERMVATIVRESEELGLEPYDEPRHRGLLRTVQLALERPTGNVQVVLVLCQDLAHTGPPPLARLLADRIFASGEAGAVFFNGQPARTNTLLGPTFVLHRGSAMIDDVSGGARVFYPPGAFGQANPDEHDGVVERIHALVPPGSRIVEFYAGVGAIGLGLVQRGESVVFNEVGADSLRGLDAGLEAIGRPARARVSPGPAGAAAAEVHGADVVIVDPPRKGLDRELLLALAASPPRRLIYLSCGLPSFVSDATALRAAGLRVTLLAGYPYFPFTEHVETLAVFDRS